MPNDSTYGGGAFRRLAAFEQSADRALKTLRERRMAEMEVKKSSQEDALFGNFLAGGKIAGGGFKPFNESNLPNVAGLATSKRYAPVLDAMLGVENIRVREQGQRDQEMDFLIRRQQAETDRMRALTGQAKEERESKEAGLPKPPDSTTRRAIADSKRNLSTAQSTINSFESNPTSMANYAKIISDPEFNAAVSSGNIDLATAFIAKMTGDTTPQKVVSRRYLDYMKALSEEPGELAYLKELGVETAPLIRKPRPKAETKYAPDPVRATQGGKSVIMPKKIKIRLTKEMFGRKVGTPAEVDESEFDASYMEKVK